VRWKSKKLKLNSLFFHRFFDEGFDFRSLCFFQSLLSLIIYSQIKSLVSEEELGGFCVATAGCPHKGSFSV